MPYDHKRIEAKWQKYWSKEQTYKTKEADKEHSKYILDMFPYPSGAGLHVGHPKGYIATDIVSRMYMMQGYAVLHPMGFDAFGLPAENYAIKHKMHPRIAVEQNIANFKKQLSILGFSYDWDREINTTDPSYYKWTQWIFLQLYKKGLAYEAELPINWCPSCQTGLANEEVIKGLCERCKDKVEIRLLRQWVLKITEYADRLLEDLEGLDWPEPIKRMQINWIGKSEGLLFTAPVKGMDLTIETFSAHFEAFKADTFVTIAPDHPLLERLLDGLENKKEILKEADAMVQERMRRGYEEETEYTGIFTGRYIEDPVSGKELPIWIASYVLKDYGTGIVKCSAHDERDFAFAKKYDIPLHPVLFPEDEKEAQKVRDLEVCFSDMQQGILQEPDEFKGKKSGEVREEIISYVKEKGYATPETVYKLRDWLFSRQRYWGEPIPIIHCDKCGTVPVPEEDLPVLLPDVESYEPTGTGESPLAGIDEWVNTTCPSCGGPAKRETNTMPQWAGSCWYYLRYIDPDNDKQLADPKKLEALLPVDLYVGGAEHAVLHLLYARFWHKVLYDIKAVPTKEPFGALRNVGLVLAQDGQKMSKSLGNVVNPDDVVRQYGADAFRLYEMFMGPFEQTVSWDTNGVSGVYRFIQRVIRVVQELEEKEESQELAAVIEETIKKVTKDISEMQFNTSVSQMMIAFHAIEDHGGCTKENKKRLIQVLAPFAPHIAEELWEHLGEKGSIFHGSWPVFDEEKIKNQAVTVVCMVNGKVRDELTVAAGTSQEEIEKLANTSTQVQKYIEGKTPKKVIFVQDKLINFVI